MKTKKCKIIIEGEIEETKDGLKVILPELNDEFLATLECESKV